MPELPEMENYRQLLSGRIIGRTITGVEIGREKSINLTPEQFEREVVGQAVRFIERRAKHLLFHLSSTRVLVLHLMLGGMMFYGRKEEKPDRTVQVRLSFGDHHLFFIGLRLGYLHLHEADELPTVMAKLGPEPFDPQLNEDRFAELLRRKNSTLKNTLVDQSVLAGIGNCYSDEICFHASLRPVNRTTALSEQQLSQLYQSMRTVLNEATRFGGYMEMPLFVGDTLTGGFDSRCRVYDREGEPCERCGHPIVFQEVSSKKSYCCLHCQH
ncbi:Fpg/Nei family DNA glycosylase [Paenibacillus cremeus]|uniref:Fpg/Nei family DNA glycosylase n=1 Tax=Paenibacillus cremeus TaxID=2163881 RepID=A0A559KDD2_9BACL|nr:DNA-formamidopyrimidine glycosylase family protein [Paenibacillus cremeus]TVY10125.1 Fpg/Nei family DNA glycosylase [Paenibacillus cremeus]